MLKLYTAIPSGNAHKPRLLLSLMNLPFEEQALDLSKRPHKTEEFLRLNPFGQVPTLVDDGAAIGDSQAILVYLAHRYDQAGGWLPRDSLQLAQTVRWLSVAANEIQNGLAAARAVVLFGAPHDPAVVRARSEALLRTLEGVMASTQWLVGSGPTIADVAIYPYLSVAHHARLSLEPYPAIREWMARVEALPGFIPMPPLPAHIAARLTEAGGTAA